MTQMSTLRRRMIEDMTVRNLSPATQRSYISAVSKFSRYFGRSPDKLELEDVRAFQVHLVSTGISWPALNQIVCSLRFFYGVTLGEAFIPERIPHAREPRKLPVVLSPDEVVQFLEAVSGLKSRAALTCCYAAGLTDRQAELLPVPYFHLVFTLPAPIAEIAFQNKTIVHAILFKAAADPIMAPAANPRRLGAKIGGLAVLQLGVRP